MNRKGAEGEKGCMKRYFSFFLSSTFSPLP
jgi:hypothetical protein